MPVYRQKNREKNRCQLAHSGETDDAYAKCNPNMSYLFRKNTECTRIKTVFARYIVFLRARVSGKDTSVAKKAKRTIILTKPCNCSLFFRYF